MIELVFLLACGAPRVRGLAVTQEAWRQAAADAAAAGGRLLAMWASPGSWAAPGTATPVVYAAFLADPGVLILELPVLAASATDPGCARYTGLETLYPPASRMQRALFDVSGIRSSDRDRRPWLHHAADGYDFIRVAGDGVHEIAVGPVHAGTIEPGHFRFSVVGEKVLKLEERFGYTHKGIEQRFTEFPILEGHRLAARIAGDSTIAYSWAYCQALEGMAGCIVPPRAAMLRALMLELERIANHLGDVGALANDAGFAFGLTQFSRVYEATPDPKLVVALGDCGCTGGVFGERGASRGRVSNIIPVDVAVPGCPPSPTRIMQGILTAISTSRDDQGALG